MDLQHSFRVPVDVPTAWALFNDVQRIAPCFPGATITSVDGDEFAGTAKVKLGPVSLTYSGTGTFLERDEAAGRAVLRAQGRDRRGNGTATAVVRAVLEPAGDTATRVVLDTDLKITGRPAAFGRGMISDVGGKILDQFAACLEARLEESAEPASGRATTTAPQPEERPVEPAPEAAATRSAEPGSADPSAEQAAPAELDLGSVLVPAAVQRWAPTLVAVGLNGLLTWWLLRRHARRSTA